MAHLNAALLEKFLHTSVAEWEAVVELDDVLDGGHWKAVSVGLGVGHGRSDYLSPVKATQPFLDVTLPQREMVAEPESVLDDAERETVAVRFAVSHRRSAYRA